MVNQLMNYLKRNRPYICFFRDTFQETIKEGSGGDGLLDLLLVRNDLPRRRLFLDVADDIWAKFKTLDRTAGMPVNLFPVPGNDAAFVRWSRAANTRKTLLDGLDGKRSNIEMGLLTVGFDWPAWLFLKIDIGHELYRHGEFY